MAIELIKSLPNPINEGYVLCSRSLFESIYNFGYQASMEISLKTIFRI